MTARTYGLGFLIPAGLLDVVNPGEHTLTPGHQNCQLFGQLLLVNYKRSCHNKRPVLNLQSIDECISIFDEQNCHLTWFYQLLSRKLSSNWLVWISLFSLNLNVGCQIRKSFSLEKNPVGCNLWELNTIFFYLQFTLFFCNRAESNDLGFFRRP